MPSCQMGPCLAISRTRDLPREEMHLSAVEMEAFEFRTTKGYSKLQARQQRNALKKFLMSRARRKTVHEMPCFS